MFEIILLSIIPNIPLLLFYMNTKNYYKEWKIEREKKTMSRMVPSCSLFQPYSIDNVDQPFEPTQFQNS